MSQYAYQLILRRPLLATRRLHSEEIYGAIIEDDALLLSLSDSRPLSAGDPPTSNAYELVRAGRSRRPVPSRL